MAEIPAETRADHAVAGMTGGRPADRDLSADRDLLDRLRARDEAAFRSLVRRDHSRLVAIARGIVGSPDLAEEVVQDTWLTLLGNLDAFEGRSSLRTWLTGIVVNKARRAGARSRRTRPFSEFEREEDGETFGPDAFLADGHWAAPPWHWTEDDLERACGERQIWAALRAAVEALPGGERAVVTLRDVEGLSAAENERALGLTEARQRALLHRGRVRLQAALADLARDGRGARGPSNGGRP